MDLYIRSVQSPESEVAFFRRVYRQVNRRVPRVMREDFCGSFAICCQWVRAGKDNLAIGVDLDGPTLDWGRTHNLARLSPRQAERVTLLQTNVLDVHEPPVDAILALNFSFCIFKRRDELLRYFQVCRRSLAPGGIFVLDIYGGPDSQKPDQDRTRQKGFTYVWDQARYDPLTNETLCHIHFLFPDGSRIMKAFTYDWRLWTLGELRETLIEAGFRETRVYWEGTGDDGSGNGIFRHRTRVAVEDAWVAYVVALS